MALENLEEQLRPPAHARAEEWRPFEIVASMREVEPAQEREVWWHPARHALDEIWHYLFYARVVRVLNEPEGQFERLEEARHMRHCDPYRGAPWG